MRNLIFLLIIITFSSLAIIIGIQRAPKELNIKPIVNSSVTLIPYIGRLEVLNGCGITGAAGAIADYLRDRSFDVKKIENAQSWNYPKTMVISRTEDLTIANKVAESMGIKHTTLLRDGQSNYNVTVIVGTDFNSRIENNRD